MLRIRLRRVGAKNKPSYRMVVADSRSSRDGAFVDSVGLYNPLTDPPTVVIDEEKTLKWLRQGAQPTEVVANLLSKKGILGKVKTTAQAESSEQKQEGIITPADILTNLEEVK